MKSWFVVILRLAATAIPVRLCFWVSLSNCFNAYTTACIKNIYKHWCHLLVSEELDKLLPNEHILDDPLLTLNIDSDLHNKFNAVFNLTWNVFTEVSERGRPIFPQRSLHRSRSMTSGKPLLLVFRGSVTTFKC